MSNKTAKDLACDRERNKLKAQIKKWQDISAQKDAELNEANRRADAAELECARLQDWVDRLLAYMDIPEENMWEIIQQLLSVSIL